MDNRTWLTRTGNPGLNDRTFAGLPRAGVAGEAMTLQGTINKSFLLLVVLLAAALWPWSQYLAAAIRRWCAGDAGRASIGGLVAGAGHQLQGHAGALSGAALRGLEGLAIGGFSAMLEKQAIPASRSRPSA